MFMKVNRDVLRNSAIGLDILTTGFLSYFAGIIASEEDRPRLTITTESSGNDDISVLITKRPGEDTLIDERLWNAAAITGALTVYGSHRSIKKREQEARDARIEKLRIVDDYLFVVHALDRIVSDGENAKPTLGELHEQTVQRLNQLLEIESEQADSA